MAGTETVGSAYDPHKPGAPDRSPSQREQQWFRDRIHERSVIAQERSAKAFERIAQALERLLAELAR